MRKGRGELDEVRGDHGGGRCWRRKREIAEVVRTRGIVAASISWVSLAKSYRVCILCILNGRKKVKDWLGKARKSRVATKKY